MLHQIPNLQMIGVRHAGHRVQTQVFPAPFHHLVVLVIHPAKGCRLLLRQSMALPQFTEALPEEFGGGNVIGHSRRFPIRRFRERRSIKYPCNLTTEALSPRRKVRILSLTESARPTSSRRLASSTSERILLAMKHPSKATTDLEPQIDLRFQAAAPRRRGIEFSVFCLGLFASAVVAWGVVVVNDPFTDGNRSNTTGGDTAGLVWFQGQPSPATLTVVDDSAGIGSGNAVKLTPDSGNFRKFLGFFNTQTLAATGDTLRLNFNYRFATAPTTASAGLRFGFYNSNATKQSSDGFGTTTPPATTRNDDKGYLASANAGVAPTLPTAVNREAAGDDILGGSAPGNVVVLNSTGGTVASGTASHHARFEITRLANGDLQLSAQIDNLAPATGIESIASVTAYAFDEIAIGLSGTGNQAPLLVDTVLVEFINVNTVTRISWYKAESSTQDFDGVNNGLPVGTVAYAPGAVGQAFSLAGNGHIDIPSPTLNAYSTGFTVAGWFVMTSYSDNASLFNFRDAANNSGFTLEQDAGVPGRFHLDVSGHRVNSDGWLLNIAYYIAATFNAPSGKLEIYRNGNLVDSISDPSFTMALVANPSLQIGRNFIEGSRWVGKIDEVQFHNRALTQTEIIGLMGLPAVSVTATGASEGGSGTFTFTRSSASAPLTVSYSLSGTAISGLDYPAPSGSVTFPDTVATQTVTISPVADAFIDPNDTVIATVTAGTGYTPGAMATMTITDTTTTAMPYSVLPKNALPLAVTNGFGSATRSVVAVTGQTFSQALRIVTPDTSASIYEAGFGSHARFVFDQPVNLADKIVVSLYARATSGDTANGEGYMKLKVSDNSGGAVSSGSAPITLTSAWRLIQIPYKMAASYVAGGARLNVFAGYGPQTIEIGAVRVVNHGDVNYDALGIPLYDGRELGAAWRTAAAQRIELHRKADFTVQIRDAAGSPVSGASVRVRMKRHAFGFGGVTQSRFTGNDTSNERSYIASQKLRDTFLENFNWAVPENNMKWTSWEPTSGTFSTSAATKTAQWLRDHGVKGFRGHVFVWPGWSKLPGWLRTEYDNLVTNNGAPAAEAFLRARVLDHISQQAGVVGSLATRWDVLNEPFDNHDLQDILGRTEVVPWFQRARQVVPPGTPLVLNDYDNEGDDLPRINFNLRTLQEAQLGQPETIIDGVGIQTHLDVRQLPSMERVLTVLNRYAALGKQIEITEFDVGTDGDEQLQADYLRDYLTLIFSHPAVKSFLVWAFWEGASFQADRALYRTNWTIKPNGQMWRDLVHGAWWTDSTVTADANGNATVRGFLGDYEITATAGTRALTIAASLPSTGATVALVPRKATTVTLNPTADTHVQDNLATSNFGTATELVTKQNSAAGTFNRDAYLKFALNSVPTILSAKLRLSARLNGVSGSTATYPVGLTVHAVADTSWDEMTMTWDNKPDLGAVLSNVNVLGTMPSPAPGWVELDVTAYLQAEKAAGRNIVTLGLHNGVATNPQVFISSREGTAPPELVITAPLPDATTGTASGVTSSGASVQGTVTANNPGSTFVFFDYGVSTAYSSIATATQSPVTGASPMAVSATLSGLLPGTLYHYRVRANGSIGAGTGDDATFTTLTLEEAWRMQFFGITTNSGSAADDADPDGDGESNLFEYVAGLSPVDPTSRFALRIERVPGQPTQKGIVFSPLVPGRTYTVKSKASLADPTWLPLASSSTPPDNGNERKVVDLSANPSPKFYVVEIVLP